MKVTRDMAVFDEHLPLWAKAMGYAMGLALKAAARIDRAVSAPFLNSGSTRGRAGFVARAARSGK